MSEMMSYRRGFTLPDDLPCYFQKSSVVCISLRSQYFQFQSLFVMLVFFFLFWLFVLLDISQYFQFQNLFVKHVFYFLFWLCYLTFFFQFQSLFVKLVFFSYYYFDCLCYLTLASIFSFKACLWSMFFASYFVCVTWHKPVFSVSKLCFQG